jgi:hypothetical protein
VFVSYAREDVDYVRRLVDNMKQRDLPVWNDEAIIYSDRFPRAISEAIRDSKVLVLVMTPASRRSSWVRREIELADKEKIPIFPLLLKGSVFKDLADRHYQMVADGEQPSERWFDILAEKFPVASPSDVVSEVEVGALVKILLNPDRPLRIGILGYDEQQKAIFSQRLEHELLGLPGLTAIRVDLSYYAHDFGAIPAVVRAILSVIPKSLQDSFAYRILNQENAGLDIAMIHQNMEDLLSQFHEMGNVIIMLVNHVESLTAYDPMGHPVGVWLIEFFKSLNNVFRSPGLVDVVFFNLDVVEQILRIHYKPQSLEGYKSGEGFVLEKFMDSFLDRKTLTELGQARQAEGKKVKARRKRTTT